MYAQRFHYDIACKNDAFALCVKWEYARTVLPLRLYVQGRCFCTVRKVEVCAPNASTTTLGAEWIILHCLSTPYGRHNVGR